MRWCATFLLIGCSGMPASDPDAGPSVFQLCAAPGSHPGARTRIAVDLTSNDYLEGLSTLVACIGSDGGHTAECCNSVSRTFRLPCGDPPFLKQIPMIAGPNLGLAPTGYGAFRPAIAENSPLKEPSVTLGCIGCETGVSCSPSDPSKVKAVHGAMSGRSFVVDALEF